MANSTLLLADDSVTIQKVVNLTFAGEGIDVIAVGDGNSAMDILRESRPDIVIADVNMPGLTGYEICEKVKAMDGDDPIPVILLVGSFEPFDSEEASRVGADAHLTKPFESIAALVDTVHDLMGGGNPAETPRFDDTVEYPTGSDIVLGPQDMPFASGFEDETIQAESYKRHSEDEPSEQSEEPSSDSEEEAGEQQWEAPGDAGGTYTDLAEETPSDGQAVTYEEPESTPAEFAETQAFEEGAAEIEYSESSYYESVSYGESTESQAGPEGDEFAAERFEPQAEESPAQAEESGPEFGQMTVELDEADLLELPVDLSSPEQAGSEQDQPIEVIPSSSSWDEPVPYDEMAGEEESPEETPPYQDETPGYAEGYSAYEEEAPRYGEEPPSFETESSGYSETPMETFEPEESHQERFEATIREVAYEHTTAEGISGTEISDEVIEAIARRVVEKLSDKAVREIAWEVVPDMAEIIIRKMVEERMND